MSQRWQESSDSFLKLTIREQYLVLLTGLVAIFFIIFYLFIDDKVASNASASKSIIQLTSSRQSLKMSVLELQSGLKGDINKATKEKIGQYKTKLAKIDKKLLKLTSDLINPIQMRYALLDLLKLEKGVSLLSFELLGAKPLLSKPVATLASNSVIDYSLNTSVAANNFDDMPTGLNLYRHGIKIKLSGSYFDLRNYLIQLEKLPWKFFWQDFNYILTEYPISELEIEMYSLGTKKEFVGV